MPVRREGNGRDAFVLLILLLLLSTATVAQDSPLLFAASAGNEAKVQELLAAGAAVDHLSDGFTPLQAAVGNQRAGIARLLVRGGANLEVTTKVGWTPLLLASALGDAAMVKMLLEEGANPHATSQRGETAIVLLSAAPAERSAYYQLRSLEALLQAGVDPRKGEPLLMAALQRTPDYINLLVRSGAPVDTTDGDGVTALILAASRGRVIVVEALLALGARKDLKDARGKTARDYAIDYGDLHVVGLLSAS